MKTYRLSPVGRRTSLVLLVGALLIWAFALWSFASTLKLSYNPAQLWPTLQASLSSGLGVGQVVPALLMLALIVATPLLIWNLLEEWSAAYTPDDDGLRFDSLGIMITCPWPTVAGLRSVDDDGDEPLDEILLRQDATTQITNPLLRFLHRQAYGRRSLPVYAGLEDRADLLSVIRHHTASIADV
jgi:hypothetical protein